MCKIFNKIMGKTLASKTKTHFFQPKTLNLYFKNSINPSLKVINVVNVSAISFELDESSDSKFIINAIISSFNNESIKFEIAEFNSKELAINALDEIRVKLYMPTKTLSKWLLLVILAIVSIYVVGNFTSKLSDISSGFMKKDSIDKVDDNQQSNMQQPIGQVYPSAESVNNGQVQAGTSPAEIQGLIDQLEQLKQIQNGVETGVQVTAPQQEDQGSGQVLTDADKLLQGLK